MSDLKERGLEKVDPAETAEIESEGRKPRFWLPDVGLVNYRTATREVPLWEPRFSLEHICPGGRSPVQSPVKVVRITTWLSEAQSTATPPCTPQQEVGIVAKPWPLMKFSTAASVSKAKSPPKRKHAVSPAALPSRQMKVTKRRTRECYVDIRRYNSEREMNIRQMAREMKEREPCTSAAGQSGEDVIRDTLNERPSRKRNDGLIRFIAEKKLKKIERAREIKDGDPWEVLKTANQSEMKQLLVASLSRERDQVTEQEVTSSLLGSLHNCATGDSENTTEEDCLTEEVIELRRTRLQSINTVFHDPELTGLKEDAAAAAAADQAGDIECTMSGGEEDQSEKRQLRKLRKNEKSYKNFIVPDIKTNGMFTMCSIVDTSKVQRQSLNLDLSTAQTLGYNARVTGFSDSTDIKYLSEEHEAILGHREGSIYNFQDPLHSVLQNLTHDPMDDGSDESITEADLSFEEEIREYYVSNMKDGIGDSRFIQPDDVSGEEGTIGDTDESDRDDDYEIVSVDEDDHDPDYDYVSVKFEAGRKVMVTDALASDD